MSVEGVGVVTKLPVAGQISITEATATLIKEKQMSVEGVGLVGAVPVAGGVVVLGGIAVVTAAAAVAVAATAGVGICYVGVKGATAGAKGAIVCGQAVVQVCHEQATKRRALNQLNNVIARRLKARSEETFSAAEWQGFLEAAQQQQSTFMKRLKALRLKQTTSVPEIHQLQPPQRKNRLAKDLSQPQIVTEIDFGLQADYLEGVWEACIHTVEQYKLGNVWEGLFDMTHISNLLDQARQDLKEENLVNAEMNLRSGQRLLLLMQQQATHRWQARQKALHELQAATEILATAFDIGKNTPDLLVALTSIQETFQQAEVAFDKYDFAQAEALACSVSLSAGQLAQAPDRLRYELLKESLATLQIEINEHRAYEGTKIIQNILDKAKKCCWRNHLKVLI